MDYRIIIGGGRSIRAFAFVFGPNGYFVEMYGARNTPPVFGLCTRDQRTRISEFLFDPVLGEIDSLGKSFGFPAGHERAAV